MAREYYFYTDIDPYRCANFSDSVKRFCDAFSRCVYDTLREYGMRMSPRFDGPQEKIYFGSKPFAEKYRAYIIYYRDGVPVRSSPLGNDAIELYITVLGEMYVDFKYDPVLSEVSNDEVMDRAKARAAEQKLMGIDKRIYTTSSQGLIQLEEKYGPNWWIF